MAFIGATLSGFRTFRRPRNGAVVGAGQLEDGSNCLIHPGQGEEVEKLTQHVGRASGHFLERSEAATSNPQHCQYPTQSWDCHGAYVTRRCTQGNNGWMPDEQPQVRIRRFFFGLTSMFHFLHLFVDGPPGPPRR